MKTIIVPIDFSATATNAMNYAVDLALDIEASVMLLHVYAIPVSMPPEVPTFLFSSEEIKKNSELKLDEIKKTIAATKSDKLKIYTEVVLGNTTAEIAILCDQFQPFAVVMGAKGLSNIESVLFGSTTLSCINHLKHPIVVVPHLKEYGKGIKKIGLACDFKKVVETVPSIFIKQMVNEFHAELHIINVDYEDKHFKTDTPEQSMMLHTLFEDLNPKYHFINHTDIEDGINEFAENNNLDLVITIPKKHTLLENIFTPRSTKQLIKKAHVPIMCVHSD